MTAVRVALTAERLLVGYGHAGGDSGGAVDVVAFGAELAFVGRLLVRTVGSVKFRIGIRHLAGVVALGAVTVVLVVFVSRLQSLARIAEMRRGQVMTVQTRAFRRGIATRAAILPGESGITDLPLAVTRYVIAVGRVVAKDV